ncbi:MAG: hypothetical protein R3F20_06415 [Planctomycetota bacterium]
MPLLALLLLALGATALSAQDEAPPVGEDAEVSLVPGPENLRDWLDFIRPSEAELAWERIGWRNEFWPAVEEARKLGRPILLWTMNGHPLGCT